MSTAPSVRRIAPDEWRTYRSLRLRALAEAPTAFGATLADEERRTDDEWFSRLASSPALDLPLVAEVAGLAVGLAWGRIDTPPEIAHVYQMWVAPTHRRIGVGLLLLNTIIEWAIQARVRWLLLDVATDNAEAVRLYLRAGFVPDGEPAAIWSSVVAQPMRLDLGDQLDASLRKKLTSSAT